MAGCGQHAGGITLTSRTLIVVLRLTVIVACVQRRYKHWRLDNTSWWHRHFRKCSNSTKKLQVQPGRQSRTSLGSGSKVKTIFFFNYVTSVLLKECAEIFSKKISQFRLLTWLTDWLTDSLTDWIIIWFINWLRVFTALNNYPPMQTIWQITRPYCFCRLFMSHDNLKNNKSKLRLLAFMEANHGLKVIINLSSSHCEQSKNKNR